MFRHKKNEINESVDSKKIDPKSETVLVDKVEVKNVEKSKSESENIKDLLEKNLKWSQIIYEQNRKINRKLMWAAVANWLRIFIILIPLGLAVWFLPPYVRKIIDTYGGLLGNKSPTSLISGQANSIDQIIKMLPLDPAKQEQIKALLK